MVEDLKPGGTFLLNCGWDRRRAGEETARQSEDVTSPRTTSSSTPSTVSHIGKEIGLGGRINTILQAAFFKLANIIPIDDAVQYMKDAATKSYGKKGEKIVAMNHAAIDRGVDGRCRR